MRPDFFPSPKLEALYKELKKDVVSEDSKYKELVAANLADTFEYDGKTLFTHPEAKWETFVFRIPIIESENLKEKTNLSKMIAFKEIYTKWFLKLPANVAIDEKNYQKTRAWFIVKMMGYATISVPEKVKDEFEEDFNRTRSTLVNITPKLAFTICSQCHHEFITEEEEQTIECRQCGFTFIKK